MKAKMRKFLKSERFRDLLCILLFVTIYILLVLIKTQNGRYLMASKMDFRSQHYTIPEYFRTLYYDTGDLFPDFSFHLGAGQNIYALSYYGLFSPIVLLSYLFPSVSMLSYITAAMAVILIASISLFYFFLLKNGYRRTICVLCSLFLLLAAPMLFHSARHIMFISYMPFLILGLYGVDRYIEKKKSFLLILSITLMIFTSYYFSIPGMVTLIVYGLFKYIRKHGFCLKKLISFSLRFSLPYITAVLIGGILLLPTLYSLMSGRTGTSTDTSLFKLFIPNMYMLYTTYSMGLTAVCGIGCLCLLFGKRLENRLLCCFLLIISIFPFFNYLLNAGLYINAKVLIPFIVLVLINTADFLTLSFEKLKKILKIKPQKLVYASISLILIVSPLICCLMNMKNDTLITKESAQLSFSAHHQSTLEQLYSDENIYRVNTSLLGEDHVNRVASTKEYKTSLYSSVFNGNYRTVYRDLFENPLYDRNEFIVASSHNLIFQMYMGEKYVYSYSDPGFMYEAVDHYENIELYRNPYVLPIGYATDRTINSDEFAKLSYPDNMLSLLGTAVTDGKETNAKAIKTNKLSDISYTVTSSENLRYQKSKFGYTVDCSENGKIQLNLQDISLKNQLIFLDFSLKAKGNDLSVTVNGISNLLTAADWKYYNQNNRFAFVIPNETNVLNISFTEGCYEISDLSVSVLNFDTIKNIHSQIDAFIIDKDKTKADVIAGTVKVKNDGVFILSVPYDEGFTVTIDGKETEYYLANKAFIGFDIAKGDHEIVIHYNAPLKPAGFVFSGIGVALCLGITIFENRKKEHTWN